MYFNSHPREEDDFQEIYSDGSELDISTLILTKRMTRQPTGTHDPGKHFNSHPHEEDDQGGTDPVCFGPYFNSHPHEEDD